MEKTHRRFMRTTRRRNNLSQSNEPVNVLSGDNQYVPNYCMEYQQVAAVGFNRYNNDMATPCTMQQQQEIAKSRILGNEKKLKTALEEDKSPATILIGHKKNPRKWCGQCRNKRIFQNMEKSKQIILQESEIRLLEKTDQIATPPQKSEKLHGVLSDSAICWNQKSPYLLSSIENLANTLEEIITKLKKNEAEKRAYICCSCASLISASKVPKQVNLKNISAEIALGSENNDTTDSDDKDTLSNYRCAKCFGKCNTCSCDCAKVLYMNEKQLEETNCLMKSTATTMKDDDDNAHKLRVAKHPLNMAAHQLNFSDRLIQFLGMLFICSCYWLQKNDKFYFYFLIVGLTLVTVYVLKHNTLHPNYLEIVNMTEYRAT